SQCAKSKDDKARMQNVPYASAVGSIMYALRCTRPDVAFTQNITSRFQQSPEAEYIAAAEAANEAVWIRKFVDELGVVPSNNYPIEMNYNNTAAIFMAKEPGVMKGARHF
nr:putative Gag-Pol polyprotein [Tanacetum cinerariifolium]